MVYDLRTLSDINKLFKYADDTTVLSPEHTDIDLSVEFNNICSWATKNGMLINKSKTKELVFHKPSPGLFPDPVALKDIERVAECKLLGVTIQESFKFNSHVNDLLKQCSQRSFAIKVLRDQGLCLSGLDTVFQSTIISRIIYALPMWGGFASQELIDSINSFLKRMFRYKLCSEIITFQTLLELADVRLFRKIRQNGHCINFLLPPERASSTYLRPRGHPYPVPSTTATLARKSFINRVLSTYI